MRCMLVENVVVVVDSGLGTCATIGVGTEYLSGTMSHCTTLSIKQILFVMQIVSEWSRVGV